MAIPAWLEEQETEFDVAIGEILRGLRSYIEVMEAVEKKAAASVELGVGGPGAEHALYVSRRGQETGKRMFEAVRQGLSDDFNVMRGRFDQPEDNPKNRKANPASPSASELVGKLNF